MWCLQRAELQFVYQSLEDRHVTSNNAYWQGDYAVRVRKGRNITHRDIKTFEPSAVVADPSFVSASDLHLTKTSPMVDQGVAISGLIRDLDGEPRPADGNVDIGADEWYAVRQTPAPDPPILDPQEPANGDATITSSGEDEPEYACVAMAPVGYTVIIEKPTPTQCVVRVHK